MHEIIRNKFVELFQTNPLLFRSPGRVNLIGEHTDYNEGFVLPAAIDKEIWFAILPNQLDRLRLYSYDLKDSAEFDLMGLKPSYKGWANYLIGVVAQFQNQNLNIGGFDLVFGGNVPMGAGLSSSAAVECGLAFALNSIYSFGLDKLALAKIAQKAEHEFAGVRCGIMDQFASLFGKDGHVVKLDCRTLDFEYYPFNMSEYRIVLCDTQVKHSLASSEYNTRRLECEIGVGILQQFYPGIISLRDVTLKMLQEHSSSFDPIVLKRCEYIIEENLRVEDACVALDAGNFYEFGQLMFASHHGLQHKYEVSCAELDFLVHKAKQKTSVVGARMMGGGFGGCTINIVKVESIDEFLVRMGEAYLKEFKVPLKSYVTEIVAGSSAISVNLN